DCAWSDAMSVRKPRVRRKDMGLLGRCCSRDRRHLLDEWSQEAGGYFGFFADGPAGRIIIVRTKKIERGAEAAALRGGVVPEIDIQSGGEAGDLKERFEIEGAVAKTVHAPDLVGLGTIGSDLFGDDHLGFFAELS